LKVRILQVGCTSADCRREISFSRVNCYSCASQYPIERVKKRARKCDLTPKLDPLSSTIAVGLGLTYNHARQYDQAIEALHNVAELDSNSGTMRLDIGIALLGKRKYPEAIAALQDAGARETTSGTTALAMLGYAYGRPGERERARKILRQITRDSGGRYFKPTACALVCVGLGDYDQAISWLQKAYVEERGVYLTHLNVEPPWDPLRSDPRFIDILKKMGLEK
jgi:tetratricopeptide (TPR) repeat protein